MKTKTANGFTLIEIMIVVAIIGLLASIAIPCFSHAIETARQKSCALSRKNIDGVKAQWALENAQPPTATPTDADLFGEGRYIDHKPDCPAGGAYSLNSVAQKCTCSVEKHAN